MIVQITDAGVVKLNAAAGGILVLPYFRLGSDVGYVPTSDQTALRGSVVYQGAPAAPVADTPNLVRYSVILPYSLGPFTYGEIGLYSDDDVLVAILVSPVPIVKDVASPTTTAESQRIDMFLSTMGSSYNAWALTAESSNAFRLSVSPSVDMLPPSFEAVPNAYLVQGTFASGDGFLAYTDRLGLWDFDSYQRMTPPDVPILSSAVSSLVIPSARWSADLQPTFQGKTILQFATGALAGTCRNVVSATVSIDETEVALGFDSALAVQPDPADTVMLMARNAFALSNVEFAVATANSLGGVKVGNTLQISNDGVLNIGAAVLSDALAGITLPAASVTGLHPVATSGNYLQLNNRPAPVGIATPTVAGLVRVPTGDFSVDGAGSISLAFVPVRTVNGISPNSGGAVVIPVDYTVANKLQGAYSSINEFRVVNSTPGIAMLVDLHDGAVVGTTSEYLVEVRVVAAGITTLQASKLIVVNSNNDVVWAENNVVLNGERYPLSIQQGAGLNLQLVIDLLNTPVGTTEVTVTGIRTSLKGF